MHTPKFGALLMYPTGGGINFQPHGLVLTDDTRKYALDDVVLVSPDPSDGDDVFIGKSPEVAAQASKIGNISSKQAQKMKNSLIDLVGKLLKPKHFDQSWDLPKEQQGDDYEFQTYHQKNPEAFEKLKNTIFEHLRKNASAAIINNPNGTHRIVIDPFGHNDVNF